MSLARLEMVTGTGSFYQETLAARLLPRPSSEARRCPAIATPTLQNNPALLEASMEIPCQE